MTDKKKGKILVVDDDRLVLRAVSEALSRDAVEVVVIALDDLLLMRREVFDQVGGDGFMLSPIYTPGAIEEFVDLVVPELQRRGRYRRDYTGTTQRDHLPF